MEGSGAIFNRELYQCCIAFEYFKEWGPVGVDFNIDGPGSAVLRLQNINLLILEYI